MYTDSLHLCGLEFDGDIFRMVYLFIFHLFSLLLQGPPHPSLPLVDSMGPHLRLSLLLTSLLLLLQAHTVDWKRLQILLFLQGNGSFIFSISEIPRKEFSCGSIAILLPCYLYVRKTVRSEPVLPIPGSLFTKDAAGGPQPFLPEDRHVQAGHCQRHRVRQGVHQVVFTFSHTTHFLLGNSLIHPHLLFNSFI